MLHQGKKNNCTIQERGYCTILEEIVIIKWLKTLLLVRCLNDFSFCQWQGEARVTHPGVSSALPPPSSAPVWVAEQTPPLRQQWPGWTDPEPRKSPQNHLHRSSSPGMKGLLSILSQKMKWLFSLVDADVVIPLTTFHLSLTTSATDRMSVCSPAPLIPSALSYNLASVSQDAHWKQRRDQLCCQHTLQSPQWAANAGLHEPYWEKNEPVQLIQILASPPHVFKVHTRRYHC